MSEKTMFKVAISGAFRKNNHMVFKCEDAESPSCSYIAIKSPRTGDWIFISRTNIFRYRDKGSSAAVKLNDACNINTCENNCKTGDHATVEMSLDDLKQLYSISSK